MPRGDGSGPRGEGPMTGRRAGYCAGYDRPGFYGPRPRRGIGMGRGMGYARGGRLGFFGGGPGWAYQEDYPADEKEFLNYKLKELELQLEHVKGRLEKLQEE